MKLPVLYHKADLLTLPLIVLLTLFLILFPQQKPGNAAIITVSGSTVAIIDLQQDQQTLSVTGAEGFVFSIENGGIHIIQAPCSGKDCCHAPSVSAEGQWIFCLPMQLAVSVITDEQNTAPAPDAIIG